MGTQQEVLGKACIRDVGVSEMDIDLRFKLEENKRKSSCEHRAKSDVKTLGLSCRNSKLSNAAGAHSRTQASL